MPSSPLPLPLPLPLLDLSPPPLVKDEPGARIRAQRTPITSNACTTCRKKRKKCDGKSPCYACSHTGPSPPACVYELNSHVAKRELQRENAELRRQKALSDQIFDALRSDCQVPNILQLLRDREGLALIAKIARSPSVESSVVGSPSEVQSVVSNEELWNQKCESEDSHSPDMAAAPSEVLHPWTTASCDEHLIMHLFSLYWAWIHPAYLIFSMEEFIEGYKTGKQDHCTPFLVAAVCAAACDLLGPQWTTLLGQVPDVAALRQRFVTEANLQEALADRSARTWLEASRVMLIVKSRSQISGLTSRPGSVQDDGGGGGGGGGGG